MIIAILREHFRAQKFALLSLSAVIAVAAGFGAYAVTEASWKSAAARFDEATTTSAAAYGAQVALTDIGPLGDAPPQDWGTPMTSGEVAELVSEASGQSTGAWAGTSASMMLSTDGITPDVAENIYMMTASAPWDFVWPAGDPVEQGSMVLPAETARVLGVEVGDPVTIWTNEEHPREVATLTYAGMAYDSLPYATWAGRGTAYANFADVPALAGLWDTTHAVEMEALATAGVQWQSDPEQILESRFLGEGGMWMSVGGDRPWFSGGSASPWIFAAVLGLGAIVMAAAAGRAQTQRRVQWIATARVLGARRAHFVGIGAAEAGIHSVAGAVGAVAGWAFADAARRAAMADAAVPPPIDAAVPLVGWLLVAAGVVALAAVGAAIPALLATRVEPVAALKDTPAMDEVEISRRMPIAPIALGAALGWGALVLLVRSADPLVMDVTTVIGLATIVLMAAAFVEGCRRAVVTIATRLSESSRPAAVQAGLTVLAHPRQAAATAIIAGFTSAGISAWLVAPAADDSSTVGLLWNNTGYPYYWDSLVTTALRSPALGVMVAVHVLMAMVMVGAHRLSLNHTALGQALGLDRSAAVRAQTLAWGLGPAVGWIAGAAVSTVVTASISLSTITSTHWVGTQSWATLGFARAAVTALALAVALTATSTLMAFALAAVLERRPLRLAARSAA